MGEQIIWAYTRQPFSLYLSCWWGWGWHHAMKGGGVLCSWERNGRRKARRRREPLASGALDGAFDVGGYCMGWMSKEI
jgi:hypothetical protein